MASINLFVAWASGLSTPDPKKLTIADDPDALRRDDQRRRAAAELWDSFALTHLGTIINNSGTEGRAEIPADRLDDVDSVRRQVAALLDTEVAIGVGLKVTEADSALKAARRRGSNCVVLFTQDLQSEVETSSDLSKAQPAANQGAGAGFGGKTQPGGAAGAQSPAGDASAHSQGEVARSNLEAQTSPEMTHAAADFESQFHEHSDAHDKRQEDARSATQAGQDLDNLKQQVVKILQGVKAQAPQLDLMRETEPELYSAVQGLIKTLILMAHQLVDGQAPVQKSEPAIVHPMLKTQRFFAEAAFISKSGEVVGTGPMHNIDALPTDFDVALEGFLGLDGQFYDRHAAAAMAGQDTPELHSEDLGKAECKHFYGSHGRCLRCRAEKVEQEASAAPRAESSPVLSKAVRLEHYSQKPGLKVLDPKYQGTGSNTGAERARPNRVPRTYYYFAGTPPEKEFGAGHHKYTVELPHAKLYDMGADPQNLNTMKVRETPQGIFHDAPDLDAVERLLVQKGYSGYHNYHPQIPNAVALFSKQKVVKAELEKGRDIPAKEHQGIGEGAAAQPGAVGNMSMAELPMPEKEAHYHPKNLPVGSQKDPGPGGGRDVGKVKVRHADDGKTAWVSVRAGQVMSQDGHPVSSRNPGGR